MTINVTIKVDTNPPETGLLVERVDGDSVTELARIGAGESYHGAIWKGSDIRLTEYVIAATAE